MSGRTAILRWYGDVDRALRLVLEGPDEPRDRPHRAHLAQALRRGFPDGLILRVEARDVPFLDDPRPEWNQGRNEDRRRREREEGREPLPASTASRPAHG